MICGSCNSRWCFKCGAAPHAPVDCSLIKRWLTKCADDSETANYISAHTKVGNSDDVSSIAVSEGFIQYSVFRIVPLVKYALRKMADVIICSVTLAATISAGCASENGERMDLNITSAPDIVRILTSLTILITLKYKICTILSKK